MSTRRLDVCIGHKLIVFVDLARLKRQVQFLEARRDIASPRVATGCQEHAKLVACSPSSIAHSSPDRSSSRPRMSHWALPALDVLTSMIRGGGRLSGPLSLSMKLFG